MRKQLVLLAAALLLGADGFIAPLTSPLPSYQHRARSSAPPLATISSKKTAGALSTLGAATDSSNFSLNTVDKRDLAALASLPLIWSSMVIVMRILTQEQVDGTVLSPAACVFGTQLLTVPFFLAFYAAEAAYDSADGAIDATTPPRDTVADSAVVLQAGVVLGLLWMLGGLLQTGGFSAGASASHGAFLTQMTTLIVPLLQVVRGDKISPKFLVACALALPGIVRDISSVRTRPSC